MATKQITIKKGLDLPISGEPDQVISDEKHPSKVALLGSDYIGLKPHLKVSAGDFVKLGQTLFTDKNQPAIQYTSPGAGKVIEINRGERRALTSIVIALEGSDEVTFNSYAEHELPSLDRQTVSGLLLSSGLWTLIRSRPFGKVADPEATPHSLFVTAMDTNPLAPSVEKIIKGREKQFINGLTILSRLLEGKIFLCKSPGASIPEAPMDAISVVEFAGPHRAGNAGTHMHFLDPVSRHKQVWHINAQDVISIGVLFTAGTLNVDRIISLAGPSARNPRLIKTRAGASIDDIASGEIKDGMHRIISGSVLSGRIAVGTAGYLGRYHQQVTAVNEGGQRDFLGWLGPGLHKYSARNIVLSRLFRNKLYNMNTSINGSHRAIVPVGSYEKIMPLDILPTFLLRALAVDDIDESEALGCLELDEEDMALCTFVCPSKIDHGARLRRNLTLIEKEG